MKQTFKKWLRQFVKADNPIGDLARDTELDTPFPNTYSFKKIKAHLEKQNASELCMESFYKAWRLYKNKK